MNDRPDLDMAVVGAGVAGLTAAIDAAGYGHRVVVLDARSAPGGRARTAEHAGFLLNEGAHALYVGGPAWRFLEELDAVPTGGVPDAGRGIGIDGDLSGALPSGPVSLLRSPLIRGERLRMAKLFVGLPRMDTSRFDSVSVADAINELLGDGRAGQLGRALVRVATYGNDPSHASAGAALAQLRMAIDAGVVYLDGGWQTIVDSLHTEALRRGVGIRTDAKVDRVAESAGGVELTIGPESVTASTAVIAVGGPSALSSMLATPPMEVERWAAEARPCTVASLDVGLTEPWGEHPTFALGVDRPLYLSVHAPVARLALHDQSLVHVMRYHDPGEALDAEADRAECEALLDRVRPGWRDVVGYHGFGRRLVAAHDQPRAERGGLAGRPGVRVPGHERVFVAGDWIGAEGLLVDATVASSREAAQAASGIVRCAPTMYEPMTP